MQAISYSALSWEVILPVINLPQDTRMGDVGKGLGQLVGALVGGYAEHQMQQGVGSLLQDPNIAPAKLPGEVFKQFGNKGIETLAKLNALQEQQATITQKLAGAGLEAVQTRIKEAQLPVAGQEAAAKARLTELQGWTEAARPGLIGAEAAQAAASAARTTALTGPEVAKTQATTGLAENESRKTGTEADILGERLGRMRGAAASDTGLDTQLAPFKLTPEETAAAKMTYQGAELKTPGSGDAAMSAYVRNLVTSREKREAPKPTPEAEQKFSSDSVQHATSAMRFMDTFKKGGAQDIGFFSGANAKAFMERWGIPTGDPAVVDMWNAAQQQVASAATQGGGFFAQGRVKMAHDVTAGITETPLHALLATDQVADRMINALEGRLSGFAGTSTVTKPLEAALAKWKEVKTITGSFKSDVTQDGKKTIAYFEGKQIDPKTFKTLLDPEKTYDLGSRRKATGAAIVQKLQEQQAATGQPQVDPYTALQHYRTQFKYSGRE